MPELQLEIPTYNKAEFDFMRGTVEGFCAEDILMAQIPTRISRHAGPLRTLENEKIVDRPLSNISHTLSFDFEVARESKIEEYIVHLVDYANLVKASRLKNIISTIFDISDSTGNTVDVTGSNNYYDLATRLLETYSLQFNDDGKPIMPTLVVNPETAENFDYSEPTREQVQRREDVLRRKKEQFLAKKRVRRLGSSQIAKSTNLNDFLKSGAVAGLEPGIPYYNRVELEFIAKLLKGVASSHPLLSQIPTYTTRHRGRMHLIDELQEIEMPTSVVSERLEIELNIVRNCNLIEYIRLLAGSAEAFTRDQARNFYQMLDEVLDATGNTIDFQQNKPFYDEVNEMLVAYPLSFNDEGNPNLPTFFSQNPEVNERLKALQPTPEQQKRFEEIIESKRNEYLATKRTRRLS